MAERARSKDGTKETELYTGDADTPSQQGRAQGNLERRVGTRAEEREAEQGDVVTRVTKKDEKGQGDLGGHHGTGENDEHS